MIFGQEEYRYSRLMPYTFRPTENNNPHFVCCGINPGMVEIITRKAIQNDFPGYRSFDILLYEYDRFQVDLPGRALGVSWSPNTLIDEIMLSPTFQIKEGRYVEGTHAPTDEVKSCMNAEWLDSRLVGHEELWNFLLIPGVEVVNAYYSYAFRRDIMEVLAGDVNEARQRLVFPETNIPVRGVDTVAVRIVNKFNGDTRTYVWETDHKECQKQWGINAVQFQVASSLLVFFELLLKLGDWKEKTVISASTLPIEEFGWDYINDLMIHYGVKWQPVEKIDLRIKYLT
jgi:saccharopine dehydrogenase-like NADP-dependent oxidoreductase